jgi:hypothetical protein
VSLQPLSKDERALLAHVAMFGSDGYPVQKLGSRWQVADAFGVKGPPMLYRTKREATAAFEAWLRMAHERLGAVGVFGAQRVEPAAQPAPEPFQATEVAYRRPGEAWKRRRFHTGREAMERFLAELAEDGAEVRTRPLDGPWKAEEPAEPLEYLGGGNAYDGPGGRP